MQLQQLHALYSREWWSKQRTLAQTQSVVENSTFCWSILNASAEVVAFVRVLSDLTFKAMIFDVIVHESYRNSGLGQALIQAVQTDERLSQVAHFELYCRPEVMPFYQKHGFSSDLGDLCLMRAAGRL